MATITTTLVTEHAIFCIVFDQIERLLPGLESTREVKLLSTLVEGLLGKHSEAETDLAYAALDHVLAEKGKLARLRQDHKEIDNNFKLVHGASSLAEAQRLLKEALAASREHFRHEEQIVFPLLERALPGETLIELGETWAQASPVIAPA